MDGSAANSSPFRSFCEKFRHDAAAMAGLAAICIMFLLAVYAPFIASSAPLLIAGNGVLLFPALKEIFSPQSPEFAIEFFFNWLAVFLPFLGIAVLGAGKFLKYAVPLLALITIVLFCCFGSRKMSYTDWNGELSEKRGNCFVIKPLIESGPFETSGNPYAAPSLRHPCGTDHAGRDVAARMLFGARISIAVGFAASLISIVIGTFMGLIAGYSGGKTDLCIMRFVEIIICFPQFLFLLIIMSMMLDCGIRQSVLLVIMVIGLFGWPGLCRLVRAETLKQRSMQYVAAAESLGASEFSVLFRHLLPNVAGPVFVSFAFETAGAVLAESSLSFLGFGTQEPAASWGELMRQAFPDPLTYWHLTLWPGFAVFVTVISFNFLGEGIRKAL